jgi:hypothetical protein
MDLLLTSHNYINRMVDAVDSSKGKQIGASSKIKVLLLDKETVWPSCVSTGEGF